MPLDEREMVRALLSQFPGGETGRETRLLNEIPLFADMPPAEASELFPRLRNVGDVLRHLHAQGGFSKGPEGFDTAAEMERTMAHLMTRKQEVIQDILRRLERQHGPAPPPPEASATPEKTKPGFEFQDTADIIKALMRENEDVWLVRSPRKSRETRGR